MGWDVRAATAADRAALAAFKCDSGANCASCSPAGGNVHEREVEEYLQRYALDVAQTRHAHNGHTLSLMFDPRGNLAGVVGHERFELIVRGVETPVERLVVAGVRSDLHGTAVEGNRVSSHLLAAAVRDLADAPPPLLAGRVAVCNARSRGLLARHRIGLELTTSHPGYLDVVGVYDGVLQTLPPPMAHA